MTPGPRKKGLIGQKREDGVRDKSRHFFILPDYMVNYCGMPGVEWTFSRIYKLLFSLIRPICLLFLISGFVKIEAAPPAGLKFYGSDRPIDQRTSYDVFGEESVVFTQKFDVEFSLSLYPASEFGYILRLKNRESGRIYNLFYDGNGDQLVFKFNEEGRSNLIVANLNKAELPKMHWFRMKITFDLKSDSIKLRINDTSFAAGNQELPDTYRPVILFGRSDHIIDVPSFAIKDLIVGNEEKYVFALDESDGNVVRDVNGNAFGHVVNPEWLVNDAYHWRHKASFHFESVAGANYNPERKEIYYFNRDSIRIFNVISGNSEIRVFSDRCPVELKLGTNFLDTRHDKLYSYEVYHEGYSGPTVASLDLASYQWTVENSEQLSSPLHHHASYFDPEKMQFTMFGGFGRMHYSNEFFTYDLQQHKWDTLEGFTGDFLSPRYFCSMGFLNESNTVYIFGGMGNESGEQTVGRQYYYDLYEVNLDTKVISKRWEIDWKQRNMVPVRGMIILNDSSFYTLCYPEHVSKSILQLYKFSLKDGSYEILGDSIPIRSDKITTNANLYYDGTLKNLYAVVQEFEDDISSEVHVYSLSFPPISAAELSSLSKEKNSTLLIGAILLGVAGIGLGYYFFKKLKERRRQHQDPEHRPVSAESSTALHQSDVETRANAVYLFGNFTVRDRNNRDITYMFSAQLKQVFCLILQYSVTEDGIASPHLSNILWPDKPADKVKNSRGVTINHLRKVLSELDGIELVHEKGNFKIEQSPEFYCDYARCMQILTSNEGEFQREELVDIVSRGKFLQLSDHALFDSFKEQMEKRLEPVLLVETEKSYEAGQFGATVSLTEAVFNIDPLNDVALRYQIRALQKLQQEDEARIRYKAFAIGFKKAMGTDYPHAYKEIANH